MDRINHHVDLASFRAIDDEPIAESLLRHLHYTLAKDKFSATQHDYYVALVRAVRDRLIGRWISTQQRYYHSDRKRVYYLSMEFLTGRTLANNLTNLGLLKDCQLGLSQLGLDLDCLINEEWDPGLGNGGLGRLAACLLDSMATLGIPGYGYGIRYEYGIFRQRIEDGQQVEDPDTWLKFGNPWEIGRPEDMYPVSFYGHVQQARDQNGRLRFKWVGAETVMAMAYDTPVPGYLNDTVNTLRLWAAKSSQGFNLAEFNRGDYIDAVMEKDRTESISRVLYPDDTVFSGKELRLKQEYFLVSAALQDIVRRYQKIHDSFEAFPDKVAIQLNDTHPALAIPELMRIFVDVQGFEWEKSWELSVATLGYTNHTLLPEALEEWPVSLLESVLPRHLQIIYEINHRFLQDVKQPVSGDAPRLRRLSLVNEDGEKRIHMARLAVLGSHVVNGVSKLHSQLLKTDLFPEFDNLFPWRFTSTTNGVTPRRWLNLANPDLAHLITEYIGDGWVRDSQLLRNLTQFVDDSDFCARWRGVKQQNKQRLADYVQAELARSLPVDSMFDCQIKRFHEYKRQLMNILYVISLYHQLTEDSAANITPRTVLFAGKAAPGYTVAKQIIRLINAVADVVNNDPRSRDQLQIVFLPNYGVTLAELMIPAANLSQQISTAGMEASGTSNMKFALNGALTIGTLDGANIEIRDAVGDDNIFIFGMTSEGVQQAQAQPLDPQVYCDGDRRLQSAIDLVRTGRFSPRDPDLFRPLLNTLFEEGDRFMVLADFTAYADCQQRVAMAFEQPRQWTQRSIFNVARAGVFSSDETVRTYARDIWNVEVEAHDRPAVPK